MFIPSAVFITWHWTAVYSTVYHIPSLYLLSYCWFKMSQIYIQAKLTTQIPLNQRKNHENVDRSTTVGCKTVKYHRASVPCVFSDGPTHLRTLLQFHFTAQESGLLCPIDKSSTHLTVFKAHSKSDHQYFPPKKLTHSLLGHLSEILEIK